MKLTELEPQHVEQLLEVSRWSEKEGLEWTKKFILQGDKMALFYFQRSGILKHVRIDSVYSEMYAELRNEYNL